MNLFSPFSCEITCLAAISPVCRNSNTTLPPPLPPHTPHPAPKERERRKNWPHFPKRKRKKGGSPYNNLRGRSGAWAGGRAERFPCLLPRRGECNCTGYGSVDQRSNKKKWKGISLVILGLCRKGIFFPPFLTLPIYTSAVLFLSVAIL